MDVHRIVDRFPLPLANVARLMYWFCESINYRFGLLFRTHDVEDVEFGSYDPLNLRANDTLLVELLRRVEPDDIVYDVGAHRGFYTLPAASKGAEVVSFEPNPDTASKLQQNIIANELFEEIQCYSCALSDNQGEEIFYHAYPMSGLSTLHESMVTDRPVRRVRESVVQLQQLDELRRSESLPPPDFVKIDVEGHAPEVIAGAYETLEESRPTLLLQTHKRETVDSRLSELLDSLNYDCIELREESDEYVCAPVESDN